MFVIKRAAEVIVGWTLTGLVAICISFVLLSIPGSPEREARDIRQYGNGEHDWITLTLVHVTASITIGTAVVSALLGWLRSRESPLLITVFVAGPAVFLHVVSFGILYSLATCFAIGHIVGLVSRLHTRRKNHTVSAQTGGSGIG